MVFRQYKPSARLSDYIKNYWVLELDEVPAVPEPIVPDGCIEMIFHYGQPYKSIIEDDCQLQPNGLVFGQIKKAIHLLPTGKTGIFAVRFHPWGLYPFIGLPANEFTGIFISVDMLFGAEAADLIDQVQEGDDHSRIQIIEAFLLKSIKKQRRKLLDDTGRISRVLSLIQEHNGNIRVDDLAGMANMSIRQFNRLTTEITGLAPKYLARLTRLQTFFNLYEYGNSTLTQALYSSGYYDQAHFIRDFRKTTGCAPSDFLKNKSGISELMRQ